MTELFNNLIFYTFDDYVHFALTFDVFIIISQKSIFTSYRLKSQKDSIVLPVWRIINYPFYNQQLACKKLQPVISDF